VTARKVLLVNNPGTLLFVMEGLFSRIVFDAMLEMGIRFTGIVLPGRSSITDQVIKNNSLNVLNTASIESMARHHQIPLYFVSGSRIDEYEQVILKSKPDVIIVACFPFLLPPVVFNSPAIGAYNIHPSLLPAYRGPVPLFWQFYFGDEKAGITIHEIDANFDTGKIVLQESVVLEDGLSSAEATILLTTAATQQLKILFEDLSVSRPTSLDQAVTKSSYYSWPQLEQFNLSTEWHVRRVFNFIRGTSHWNQVYKLCVSGKDLLIREALEYSTDSKAAMYVDKNKNERLVAFKGGYLRARL